MRLQESLPQQKTSQSGLFWSKSSQKLDKQDQAYRVNQVLMYGNLQEIRVILENLGLPKVREIFINSPTKIYTKTAFNFIKNYILTIERPLDSSQYVKIVY